MSVNNPWQFLPQTAPYIAPGDHQSVSKFNDKPTREEKHRLRTHLPPLPFQGRVEAPVVLLGLNPGYVESDNQNHLTREFLDANWRNYKHDNADYPFFFLDPQYAGDAGQKWWHKRLAHLRQESKHNGQFSDEQLAKSLLCVQYFPYRSERYSPASVASQEYSFGLVRAAMKRNALIILLRSRALWEKAIPELKSYPHRLQVSAPLQPVLSRKQLGDAGWEKLLAALQAGAKS